MKLLTKGPYCYHLHMVQEYFIIDLVSGDSDYTLALPSRDGSRKYILKLPVDRVGLAGIKKEILSKPALRRYHHRADELATMINKARLAWKARSKMS